MKEKIKVIEGYLDHLWDAKADCDCAICLAQEQNTYADGLRQALTILTSK